MKNNNTRLPELEQFPYPPPPPLSSINATSSPPPPTTMKKFTFPTGFRFHPKDKELLLDYLAKKMKNLPLPCDYVINDVMIYHYTPDHLADMYEEVGDKEWYFFSPRDKKYKGGSRPDRAVAAGDGYWKALGVAKPVRDDEGFMVGFKRTLVFYKGKQVSAHPARKTNWKMHEYLMDKSHIELMGTGDNRDTMRLDWVLCRIYNKDYKKGGDLHTVIGPQPISSGPPHQDFKVVNDSGWENMPQVLDYGGVGIATRNEMQPNDIYGLATSICPQPLSSVPQQQNSKVVFDNSGGYWQKPVYVMGYGEEIKNNDVMRSTSGCSRQPWPGPNVLDYGGEGIATKEEMKPTDVMRAPEYDSVCVTTDMFVDDNVDWFKELDKLLGKCNPPGFDEFYEEHNLFK